MTPARFGALLMDAEIAAIFEAAGAKTDNINKLVANDVLAFKTVKGKYGIMLVKSIPANNKGILVTEVKMQQ